MAFFVEISFIQCFVVVFGLFTTANGKAGRYNDDDDDDDDDTVPGRGTAIIRGVYTMGEWCILHHSPIV